MFDDNHMDDLMKSILDSGREDVPEHVWEGVSAGLDKAARRKADVVWFRRAGAVAAAAAVAVGVMLNLEQEDKLVPEPSDGSMIAVAEHVSGYNDAAEEVKAAPEDMKICNGGRLLSYAKPAVPADMHQPVQQHADTPEATPETIPDSAPSTSENTSVTSANEDVKTSVPVETASWEDNETALKERRLRTSIVISGIAGTNNPQNKGGIKPLRSPAMEREYTRTTIEQIGSETSYGIPFSAGIGIRLNFTERWSLGMGVNYSLLTSRFNGKYIEVKDGVESLPVPGKVSNSQHYIGIPINAYCNIVSHDFINFYAYAGGAVEKCVANRYQMQASPVINHSEDVKGVQLSVNAGIGVEFMLGRYAGIYIDPSLRYYFRNSQPKSIRTAQPLMLGFEVGLRFNL